MPTLAPKGSAHGRPRSFSIDLSFFYFELSFVLKKKKNKKRTNNSLFIACLTNLNPRGP